MMKISIIVFITSIILCGCSFYAMRYFESKVSVLEAKVEHSVSDEEIFNKEIKQYKENIEELEIENKEKVEEFELWQHQNEKLEELLQPYR